MAKFTRDDLDRIAGGGAAANMEIRKSGTGAGAWGRGNGLTWRLYK